MPDLSVQSVTNFVENGTAKTKLAGKAMAGAKVTVKNSSTGLDVSVQADESGAWEVTFDSAGNDKVEVSGPNDKGLTVEITDTSAVVKRLGTPEVVTLDITQA